MRNILFIVLLFSSKLILTESLPHFSFQDQYENNLTSKNLTGYPSVILGCDKLDLELCRKAGRKLYWKMQNLLWKDANKVQFIAYLDLRNSNSMIEKFIIDSKNKAYESIYLDRKGELASGLKPDFVFLRIFNFQGKEISKEHLSSISDDDIQRIYEILKKEIKN
jgi:hypothetical protein